MWLHQCQNITSYYLFSTCYRKCYTEEVILLNGIRISFMPYLYMEKSSPLSYLCGLCGTLTWHLRHSRAGGGLKTCQRGLAQASQLAGKW